MNRLKVLVAAALLGLPLAACEEGTTPPPVGEIEGQVVIEGEGMDGIAVTLSSGAATTTSNGGHYQFSDVEGGTYTVSISGFPADASFDATSAEVTITSSGQTVTRNFSGSYIRTASLMGMVTVEGEGLAGITVNISGRQNAEMVTDANGQYTFTGLRAGNYTIEISDFDPTDVAFSSASGAVTIAVGESKVHSFDGTYVRESTIMGQVSVQGNGLGDVTVSLQGMGADEEVMTDDGGLYTFDNLRAGQYSVAISGYDAREYGFETTSATVMVEHGKTANQPFEGIMLRTASIMGQVSIEGEGLADVTVSLQGEGENQTTMTDNSGQYTFTDLPAGNFQVGISGYDTDDYSFETTSRNVSLALGATATVPFEGILLRTSGISGRVSVEGTGLDSVTVTLSGDDLDEDATTMTDATGQYAFAGLAEGAYTVAISDYDDDSYDFETTSMDVDLGDDDVQIVNFMGMHDRSASVSGMLYVDEAGKNNAYDDGEDALAAPGVALALVGPGIGDVMPGVTGADGSFAFTGLRAGPYQLVVSPVNPLIPADYAYGGPAEGYSFALGVGDEETQNIPFDITHTTVNFMVNLKSGTAMGDALPGATVSFFSDMGGTQKIGDAKSGDDGMASMRIARSAASNHTVHASVAAPAGSYHTDGMRHAVTWDAKMTMHAASNSSDIVNTMADFSFGGATIETEYGGGKALADWAISVTSDKSAAANTPAKFDSKGAAKYSEVVNADSLPVKYSLSVASNQANTLDGGSKYEDNKLSYTHTGLKLPATMDAGMIEVRYTTQTLKVYVHHERDQVPGYTGNILGGDVRVSGMINVDIRHIDANGRSRAFPTSPASARVGKSDSKGVVTFTNVPADAKVIVMADEAASASNIKLLNPDELAAYEDKAANRIMGGAFGDKGGFHHTVELCPLMKVDPTGQDHGECGSFAYVSTYAVTGQAWKNAVYAARSGDGFTTYNLLHVPGTTVAMNPVDGKNLAGDSEFFRAATSNSRATPHDDRKEFNWGQKAAGAYTVTVPAGWVAQRGAPGAATNDLASHLSPLAGALQIDVTPTTGFVYGRVVDSNGFAVDSVTVNVNGVTATSDAFGRYHAEGFAAQTRRIGASTHANSIFVETSHAGHDDTRNIVAFVANSPTEVNVTLEGEAERATVTGTVTSGSATVAGVRIHVNGKAAFTTKADGNYSVSVPIGTVTITASKAGMSFQPAKHTITVPTKDVVLSGWNFSGFDHGTITGRVSRNARPLQGVKLRATPALGGEVADSATTGVTGTYSLSVPFGNYNVTASMADTEFTPATQLVNVGPGQSKAIDDFAAVIPPSDDSKLSALSLSDNVALSPEFDGATTAYAASVAHAVDTVTVTATANDADATVAITPADADEDTDGHQVALAEGTTTTITVTVTAADSSDTDYTIAVTRAAAPVLDDATLASLTISDGTLDPAFVDTTITYAASVQNSVEMITVMATAAHQDATIAWSPATDADATAAGHQVALEVGTTRITVTVTAADGTTTKTYTINVERLKEVPSAPQQLSVTSPGSGDLTVKWRAPANEGAGGIDRYQYRVLPNETWTDAPTTVGDVTYATTSLVRSAAIENAFIDGRTSTIEVRAVASAAGDTSSVGHAASVSGRSWPGITSVVPDSAATGMAEGNTTIVTVTLDNNAFFTNTRVSLAIEGDTAAADIVGSSTLTFESGVVTKTAKVTARDDVKAAGATQSIRVVGRIAETEAAGRDSVSSGEVSITEDDIAPTSLTVTAGGVAGGIDFTSVSVTWGNAATGTRKYQTRYKNAGANDSAFSEWVDHASTLTTLKITGLQDGVSYDWEVRAVTAAGMTTAETGTTAAGAQ